MQRPEAPCISLSRAWTMLLSALLASTAIGVTAEKALAADQPAVGPTKSGLPLPRFVSLRSSRVNLRKGPGTSYPTTWVFRRAGWPLEIIEEYEGWRQVRDADGTTGWMLQAFLSGRRTALVAPWDMETRNARTGTHRPRETKQPVVLRDDNRADAKPVALLEAGVVANVDGCTGNWCNVAVGEHRGWIEQSRLWGVYPGERIR